MKNMKIKVENNLDEIVGELEKRGYKKEYESDEINYVVTFSDGAFGLMTHDVSDCDEPTTLAELRSMTIETLKEMRDDTNRIF